MTFTAQERKRAEKILRPPEAAPVRDIFIEELENPVRVIDYSTGPTGTWKDVLAASVAAWLKEQRTVRKPSALTAGSYGLALAEVLPDPPKILIDIRTSPLIRQALEKKNCDITSVDLSERYLSPQDILSLTHNEGGIELTSHPPELTLTRGYLPQFLKVLCEQPLPDWVFMPAGSQAAFNAMIAAANLVYSRMPVEMIDRYQPPHIMGATTRNPDSAADKLYASFPPFGTERMHTRIIMGKRIKSIGLYTDIYPVAEEYIEAGAELYNEKGIRAEPSSAGLALLAQTLAQEPQLVSPNAHVVVINSGKLHL